MKVTIKYSVKQIIVFFWLVFSIAYILIDLYQGIAVATYNKAYLNGQGDAFAALVEKVKNEKCESVSVTHQKGTVKIINVDCLQQNTVQKMEERNDEMIAE